MANELSALMCVRSLRLAAEIRRIAAAADCSLTVLDGATAAGSNPGGWRPPTRQQWSSAGVVLVDPPTAHLLARQEYPSRNRVYAIAESAAAAGAHAEWGALMALGAVRLCVLPGDEAELVRLLAQPSIGVGAVGKIVVVLGGRGGAGASVFAGALALRSRGRALLVDLDPMGGGADLLLGVEEAPGLRWPDMRIQRGRITADTLWEALPTRSHMAVLSAARPPGRADIGPPSAAAVRALLESGAEAGVLTVCDVSRTLAPGAEAAIELADLMVVVVPAELRSCAAARSVLAAMPAQPRQVGVVIRGPAPGGLTARDVAAAVDAPVLATMRPQPQLARYLEGGGLQVGPRSPLGRAAERVLDVLEAGTP
jgi:secretion/DNA translocation related CpaE-like protein